MGTGCSSNKVHEIAKTTQVPGLKIAVVGDLEVGKSCLLDRYINNSFSPLYIPTKKVALRNIVRKWNIPGHATVPVTFWDIPGREELDIHESYFRNLDGVIVVVDATDPLCVEIGKQWRQCVISNASFNSKPEDNGEKEEITKAESKKEDDEIREDMDRKKKTDRIMEKHFVDDIPFLLLGTKKDLIPKDDENCNVIETKENEVHSDLTKLRERLNLVQQRMEDANQEGFIGSVLVSSKCNDMSVHGAIQSFLRHILESRYVERRWKSLEKTPRIKRQRYEFSPQMETVGINKIDEEFSKADEIIHRVKSLHHYQDDSLAKFAQQCVDNDVIDSTKNASMQNCLVALRNKLDSLDLKLKLVLMEDFYTLEVKANEADAELEVKLRYTLKTFNKEYVAVTLAMLKEYPLAKEKLEKYDHFVDTLCVRFDVPKLQEPGQTVVTNSDLHRKAVIIERNRAKMRHVMHECEECLTSIQASVRQVKTAFVW